MEKQALPLVLSFAVGPLIGRYCGTKMPSDIRSTTGVLSLTFHTDLAVAKDGFSAQYYLIQQEVPESKLEMCAYDFRQSCHLFLPSLSLGTCESEAGRSVSRGWSPTGNADSSYTRCVLCFSQK